MKLRSKFYVVRILPAVLSEIGKLSNKLLLGLRAQEALLAELSQKQNFVDAPKPTDTQKYLCRKKIKHYRNNLLTIFKQSRHTMQLVCL